MKNMWTQNIYVLFLAMTMALQADAAGAGEDDKPSIWNYIFCRSTGVAGPARISPTSAASPSRAVEAIPASGAHVLKERIAECRKTWNMHHVRSGTHPVFNEEFMRQMFGRGDQEEINLLATAVLEENFRLLNSKLMTEAARGGNKDVVSRLLAAGVSANSYGFMGASALYFASWKGSEAVVDILLAEGAHDKDAALNAAARQGHAGVAAKLIAAGASIYKHAGEYRPDQPLQAAAEGGHGEVVRVLFAKAKELQRDHPTKRLLYHLVTGSNWQGKTALHLAAEAGHLTIVRELLEAGAEVDAISGLGTPLSLVLKKKEGDRAQVAALLLEYGANLRAVHVETFAGMLDLRGDAIPLAKLLGAHLRTDDLHTRAILQEFSKISGGQSAFIQAVREAAFARRSPAIRAWATARRHPSRWAAARPHPARSAAAGAGASASSDESSAAVRIGAAVPK